MKKCIITALVVLLCASSVYAGGKKETSSSAPASVPEKKPATTASSTTTGRQVTQEEIDLHKQAGGSTCDYSNITVVEGQMPTVEKIRAEAAAVGSQTIDKVSDKELNDKISSSDAMTLPSGTIYTKAPITQDPKDKALMSHEIEHVAQYQNDDAGKVFDRIVTETQNGNPYNTPGTLENDAQKVQDSAEEILKGNVK